MSAKILDTNIETLNYAYLFSEKNNFSQLFEELMVEKNWEEKINNDFRRVYIW